jgi:hypothetical protein
MREPIFVVAALIVACAPVGESAGAPVAQAQVADEMTDGWISMRSDHWVSIVYDRDPGTVLTSFPGHAGYVSYLELAGGLRPGQRKRIGRPGPSFAIDRRGNYILREWMMVGPLHREPSSRTIGKSYPHYRCYHNVLRSRGAGEHIMTLAEWRIIEACSNANAD